MPQQESVFEPLTAREFVRLTAFAPRAARPGRRGRAGARDVGLDPSDSRRLPAYSKGMRQRVKVAQALVHDPSVLILDEPLTGLDPRQRADMIALFRRLGSEGRCVLVSSHVLDEVERLGSRILVMSQGRLAAAGDFRELRALMDDRPHARPRALRPAAASWRARCSRPASAVGARLDGDEVLELDTNDARELARALAPVARERDARLFEVSPARRRPRGRLPLPGAAMSSLASASGRAARDASLVALYRLLLRTQVTVPRLLGIAALGALSSSSARSPAADDDPAAGRRGRRRLVRARHARPARDALARHVGDRRPRRGPPARLPLAEACRALAAPRGGGARDRSPSSRR